VGDVLRYNAMSSSDLHGSLCVVLLLRPQLPQPSLLPLRDRSLSDQAAEDDLAGGIEPVAGERVDDLTPYALLEGIEIYRGFRTTSARDAWNDGERS
jgi:hypothetical protein